MEPAELSDTLRRLSRAPLWTPDAHHRVALERAVVERLLRHRDPFLLVDRVVAADPTRGLVQATRVVDAADPVLAGHFPGAPVYPGVLVLEALGQAGLCALGLAVHDGGSPDLGPGLASGLPSPRPIDVRITRVHHAVFLAPVRPGDTMVLTAQIVESDTLTARMVAQARRDEVICALCVMEVYLD